MGDPGADEHTDADASEPTQRRRRDVSPRQRRAQSRRRRRELRRSRRRGAAAPPEEGRASLDVEEDEAADVDPDRVQTEHVEVEDPDAPPPVREVADDGGSGQHEDAKASPSGRGRSRRRGPSGRRQRRTRLRIVVVALLIAAAGALVAVALSTGVVDRARDLVDTETPAASPVADDGDRQPSMVIVTEDDGEASAITLLAVDRESGEGTVLLVPPSTIADVPGYGSFELGEAYRFGQAPLVAVSLDNLLGVRTDGVATVSRQGWASLFTRTGGFEVEVGSRLVEATEGGQGGGEVRFEPGAQFLDGPRLAEYLTFREQGETELDALPRVQRVLLGVLDVIADDPQATLDALFEDGAPMLDTGDTELARTLLRELAVARADDEVTALTLPVSPLGSGREDVYRLDSSRATSLVGERLEASRPEQGDAGGRRVQILNGNGTPGIGQQVAERLADGGYRVVLTGNADDFDHAETRILVYDDSDEQLAVARDIRERLGVGQVERAGTPQSVVDVTIVVGDDFAA